MSDQKVASFAELEQADGIEFDTVEAYGKTISIGSLSSADMFEWVESNNSEDKTVRREAGLRLLIKSIVDENRARLPKADHERWLTLFRNKSNKENGKVVAAALKLNGFDKMAGVVLKNDSGEASTDASPVVLH